MKFKTRIKRWSNEFYKKLRAFVTRTPHCDHRFEHLAARWWKCRLCPKVIERE